jgi:hypothetical protein
LWKPLLFNLYHTHQQSSAQLRLPQSLRNDFDVYYFSIEIGSLINKHMTVL